MDHEGTPVFFGLKKLRNGALKSRNNLGVVVSTFNMTVAGGGGIIPKVKVWSPKTKRVHTCEMDKVKHITGRQFDPNSVLVLDWRAIIKDIPVNEYIVESGEVREVINIPFRAKLARIVDIPMAQWPKDLHETILSWEPIACLINLNGNDVVHKGKKLRWSNGVDGGNAITQTLDLKNRNIWVAYIPGAEVQAWHKITERSIGMLMDAYKNRWNS